MSILFENALIVVRDISGELPRHPNWPYNHSRTARYTLVPDRRIDRVYWHHTAGGVPRGKAGPLATTRYCVADPDPEDPDSGGRGWPGMPYHFFIPYYPETTPAGQVVIYQCQPFDLWTWHTGGHNEHGLGVVCQGCFLSRHTPKQRPLRGQTGFPTAAQMVASHVLWSDYLKPTLKLTNKQLSGHFEAGKPTCPGDTLEAWVKQVQALPD